MAIPTCWPTRAGFHHDHHARPGFRFSLRTLLVVLTAVGAAAGVLGCLLFHNLELFIGVLWSLSTIVPDLAAIGTILWLGFRGRRKGLMVWGGLLLAAPILGIVVTNSVRHYAGPGGLVSTRRLSQERLPPQIDAPWVWCEATPPWHGGQPQKRQEVIQRVAADFPEVQHVGPDQRFLEPLPAGTFSCLGITQAAPVTLAWLRDWAP